MVFWPELEPPKRILLQRPRTPGAPRSARIKTITNPCDTCPHSAAPYKVPPTIPIAPILAVVGMAPGAEEEAESAPFVGPAGVFLRGALSRAGIDPNPVFYGNLSRCRPPGDDFDTPAHARAEKHCRTYLEMDLASYLGPVLLLGKRPLHMFAGNEFRIGAYRGLWIEAKDILKGRACFVARHPAQILRTENPALRETLTHEFYADIQRMADHLLHRVPPSRIKVTIFESPLHAKDFMTWLAQREKPWTFDIETYDANAFPARKNVSTDPCHPDFRLRGIAVATSSSCGYWIECLGWEDRIEEASTVLSPAFTSSAPKGAFAGHFDEEGLVYPRWVTHIRNRNRDGMLALIALGNGAHESLRLEKAVVDILGKPQYWNGFNKSMMRDLPLVQVAENAVGDAAYAHELCDHLHQRLEQGAYL